MKPHEFANLFPMMSEAEIRTLAVDIKERGQQNPIWLFEGKILDGRNRYEACRINKETPVMEVYKGIDPLGFVISNNLHRRHLNESQRAMVAASIANLLNGKHAAPIGSASVSQQKAADMLSVGRSSVTRAKIVQKNGIPELVEAVRSGEVAVATAANVSELPEDEQRKVVSRGAAAIKEKGAEIEKSKYPDGYKSDNRQAARMPKYVPEDAEEIWQQARITLDRILPNDKHRETVLKDIINYCNKRLATKK